MKQKDTRERLGKRMDELAREYAAPHDEEVKAEIEEISLQLAEWRRRLGWCKRKS